MTTTINKTSALALAAALGLATTCAHAAETRNGREVFDHFRAGLAEPTCPTEPSRWTKQFAHAPQRLADRDSNTLELFGHVVESVRAAHLPSEYALIPFVESGYKPNARSGAGPAGLWQMIGTTARNHDVPMRAGYDGRMSPVDSTKAAVRYLKTLHGMFGGNWRLAVMAYNAGEYRVFGAIKRAGQTPRSANPQTLAGLSGITTSYDDKLHAISCVIAQAQQQPRFLAALDRPIRSLGPTPVSSTMVAMVPDKPEPAAPLIAGLPIPAILTPDVAAVAMGTPSTSSVGTGTATGSAPLAAVGTSDTALQAPDASAAIAAPVIAATNAVVANSNAPRRHTVAVGDNLWTIARRYKVSVADLLSLNGLQAGKLIAPGMVLAVDSLAAK
ncbi:lytic transglycosylase domain-containing protein [Lysobacter claricitrinus]|uniref:lytic transglycosylase domain-containing protein n=1 Tax=Lysobacter claricitrinus TaxID=3367728 RepID=UPI0037DB4136